MQQRRETKTKNVPGEREQGKRMEKTVMETKRVEPDRNEKAMVMGRIGSKGEEKIRVEASD